MLLGPTVIRALLETGVLGPDGKLRDDVKPAAEWRADVESLAKIVTPAIKSRLIGLLASDDSDRSNDDWIMLLEEIAEEFDGVPSTLRQMREEILGRSV